MRLNPLAVILWGVLFCVGFLTGGMHAAVVWLLCGLIGTTLIWLFGGLVGLGLCLILGLGCFVIGWKAALVILLVFGAAWIFLSLLG